MGRVCADPRKKPAEYSFNRKQKHKAKHDEDEDVYEQLTGRQVLCFVCFVK